MNVLFCMLHANEPILFFKKISDINEIGTFEMGRKQTSEAH